MDADDIVKCIQQFFGDFLPKANCSANWDEDSITNVFQWAQFCEQIHHSYNEDACKAKLDDLIHSIPLTFKERKDQVLCFEDLKDCTALLCEAFFENPYVENDLIESVLLKIKGDKTIFEDLKNRLEIDSICIDLLEKLKNVKIIDSDRSFYLEVKAEIYLNMLKDTVQHMTSEEQVEKYLSCALEQLCNSKEEIMLLLHALMHKVPDPCSSIAEIQQFAINWTMFKILSEGNCFLAQFIWKELAKLRRISLNSTDFQNFYLDFLTRCSLSLRCNYEADEAVWIPGSSETGELLSFEEILFHFRSLLEADDDVCECTRNHLLNLLNTQPHVVIWKEIFSCVS